MTKRHTKPAHAITLTTYDELEQFVEAFARGNLNLLIVIGRAGIAKSQTIRQAAGDDTCWIESNATAFGICNKVYEHKDELIVIDDVHSLYSDRSCVRLFKCLYQTDSEKRVAWHTAAATGNLPSESFTKSRVCIIANDWKSLGANTAAVEDRGHLIIFDPTPKEVHLRVAFRHGVRLPELAALQRDDLDVSQSRILASRVKLGIQDRNPVLCSNRPQQRPSGYWGPSGR